MKGWQEAWQEALYGPDGFYRSPTGPAGHFSTATHGGPGAVLGAALARLAADNRLTHVVDVGAGRGELLTHVYAAEPALRLTGVDVVARPPQLDEVVEWLTAPGGARLPAELDRLDGALVVAHEWLDVVPCPVAEVDDAGVLRHVLVDPASGEESLGDHLDGAELDWATTHWPTAAPGDRVEVGLPRDRAWADLVSRVDRGVVVAVDYGHRGGDRPTAGTLTAYRRGQQVAPVPDGSCDLTAHVAMDTLDHDELVDQRTALRGLGVDGRTPPVQLATSDPQAYLRALGSASAAAALVARGGFGDFLWAVKRVG
ncbi:SAM-dependent methyltransferase, MidA family [Pedococcus dokdonensis]|uniref:SAM-dependent methyltransferase, MidA family n=1 Tax=Pedococcus dokdonensis TaxID=443156 RepID=A0A1H0UUD8_9MICO|nr:SAM-dependent methyltransferase [Pedococcus dokdonensis]SDP69538.1 SAM-dependent methyltransferase, MidA family [Pedococcus dokdonensis]